MSLNPSIGLVGVAIQADRDTTATEPTFLHGLTGGTPFGMSRSIANTAVACGNRAPSDARVDSIEFAPSIESLCYPDVFGLYLYAGLGKVVTSADSKSGYYKHVFTMGSDLPYLTVWGQVGNDGITRTDGCKLGTLEISATGNEHLAMTASLSGIDGEVGLAEIPGDAKSVCYDGKLTTTDCEFKLDASSETPAEALVSEATFTIENNTSGQTSLGRAMPRDIANGNLNFGVSVTTIPDNIKEYQKMVTGSADSTKVSSKVVMGSVYAKFMHTDDPNIYVEIAVNHIPFTADFPEVDPEGSEATIQFSTDSAIITAAGESPVTITLVNKTASYDTVTVDQSETGGKAVADSATDTTESAKSSSK